jgi:hydroxypyruvate isomerase
LIAAPGTPKAQTTPSFPRIRTAAFPYDFEKVALRDQLRQHGLTQMLHNLPAGDRNTGERGIAIFPDRVDQFRDGVQRAIDCATALDCRVNCLVGIVPPDADLFELREVLLKNLRFVAAAFARERIRLLVEPINTLDMPGFFPSRPIRSSTMSDRTISSFSTTSTICR